MTGIPGAVGFGRSAWPPCLARLLAAALILFAGLPLAAQTPADIAAATRDLAVKMDLQTEFPTPAPAEEGFRLPDLMSLDTARVLLWVAVLCGAGVLAYFVSDILPAFGLGGRPRWDADTAMAAATGPGTPDAARVAADELAAQGRFVEAMHVLLLQGLDEMRRRLDLSFADSLTSREIVGRADAPGDAKAALRDIIAWVERAYFGDHPAGAGEYDACRRSYVALDGALRAAARGGQRPAGSPVGLGGPAGGRPDGRPDGRP